MTIRDYFPESFRDLYIGLLADKEISRIAGAITEFLFLFRSVSIFDFAAERGAGGRELYEILKNNQNVSYVSGITDLKLKKDCINIFCGSFYTVEKVLNII